MGLLNVPGPVYGWLDAELAGFLPPLARILCWGVVAGLVSMGLYALIAPQARIARGKCEIAQTRQALDAHDGALAEAGPIIGRLLGLSLGQVRLTTWPAVVASLPLLTVLVWMSTAYGHSFPAPGEGAPVEARPEPFRAEWVEPARPGQSPGLIVSNGNGERIAQLDLSAPVTVVHQWQWWNVLLGNPAGYLPSGGSVEQVRLDLPRQRYLALGPEWARGWEVPFFAALLLASIGLKVGARIQ